MLCTKTSKILYRICPTHFYERNQAWVTQFRTPTFIYSLLFFPKACSCYVHQKQVPQFTAPLSTDTVQVMGLTYISPIRKEKCRKEQPRSQGKEHHGEHRECSLGRHRRYSIFFQALAMAKTFPPPLPSSSSSCCSCRLSSMRPIAGSCADSLAGFFFPTHQKSVNSGEESCFL